MAAFTCKEIKVRPHHVKNKITGTRARYREGRKGTAVKVYTINQESNYLLIQGVPAVGAKDDLKSLCEQYGSVRLQPVDEYPCEEFTEVYLAFFDWFPAARAAKKQLDDKAFFGGTLHVCYAPEFETIEETRRKLKNRRKYVTMKSDQVNKVSGDTSSSNVLVQRSRVEPEEFSTDPPRAVIAEPQVSLSQPISYIWAGKEYTVYPDGQSSNSTLNTNSSQLTNHPKITSSTDLLPRPLAKAKISSFKSSENCTTTSSHSGSSKSFEESIAPSVTFNINRSQSDVIDDNPFPPLKRRK